jgi:ATP-dependent Clp protease ATP-binding subunit ClpC
MNPKQFLENFSTHLKNVIAKSISLSASFQHDQVAPLHLLLALLQERGSVGAELLTKVGVKSAHVLDELSKIKKTPPMLDTKTQAAVAALPELSAEAKQVLEKAMLGAYEYEHKHVGTEHLLSGLIEVQSKEISDVLKSAKADLAHIIEQLDVIFTSTNKFPDVHDIAEAIDAAEGMQEGGAPQMNLPRRQKSGGGSSRAVDMFAVELTDPVIQADIDPVIGRETEIERLVHILSRRTKNNPVLVGEPGVGKTAIVEGLAKRILNGDVPAVLQNKKIFSLDMTQLVAGTIYRGEFEGRIKQLIDEVSSRSDYILFIDEIHNIIGTGSNQGTMDAANILKPALARGKLRCIGATTYDEYKKYVTSDPALERRFQPVTVEEPSTEEAVSILTGVKKHYDKFHGTNITADAIAAAVELSQRYIHDNFLPDKAIDLIDEAAAAVKTKKKPTVLQTKHQGLLKDLEVIKKEKRIAINEESLEKAAKLKKKVTALEKKIAALEGQVLKAKKRPAIKVTKDHVVDVMSSRLQLDKKMLSQNQWELLSTLTKRLKKHIVGQDHVLEQVTKTLQQASLGVNGARGPVASMLFAGPSGVGKTALAKALATELYHDERALIRLDMSEFAEGHGVSKLLGSPAGYVGYKDRNHFIDEIKKRPYAVVLFDEIDKAHKDVTKLLLQILDEGTLTDSNGKKVRFDHATIILTTNIGADLFKTQGFGFGKKDTKSLLTKREKDIQARLKDMFGSALVGRLNSICLFSPLTESHIAEIVQRHMNGVNESLQKQQDLSVKVTKEALAQLVLAAHNPDIGARHVGRVVEQTIQELVVEVLQKKTGKKMYKLTHKENTFTLL